MKAVMEVRREEERIAVESEAVGTMVRQGSVAKRNMLAR